MGGRSDGTWREAVQERRRNECFWKKGVLKVANAMESSKSSHGISFNRMLWMTFPRLSFGGWTDRGFQQAEGLYGVGKNKECRVKAMQESVIAREEHRVQGEFLG